jgi:hypothetical protein
MGASYSVESQKPDCCALLILFNVFPRQADALHASIVVSNDTLTLLAAGTLVKSPKMVDTVNPQCCIVSCCSHACWKRDPLSWKQHITSTAEKTLDVLHAACATSASVACGVLKSRR